MATASLKITLRDGKTECFSQPVGKNNDVDYQEMDKALLRLQEQSNTLLTVHVEKEKEMMKHKNGSVAVATDDAQDDDDEDSSDEEEDDDEKDKPPEKKPKIL